MFERGNGNGQIELLVKNFWKIIDRPADDDVTGRRILGIDLRYRNDGTFKDRT